MSALRNEMLRGMFWSAVERYSSLLVSLIVSAILARLISPVEFGIVTIATVIINFLAMFSDMGLGPAIIQDKQLTDSDLSSIFSYSILLGLILSAVLFASSGYIADFYHNAHLVPICRILSVNLLFMALNIVPNALILKNKRFKFIAKRTLTFQVSTGIISVIYAFYGGGVYALLISPVVSSIGIFIMNYVNYPHKIDWKFRTAPLKRVFSFSIFQFLFSFINYFSRNADKLIIGKSLTMNALGYYDKSYRLMMLPIQNITNVVNPVLQPFFSDYQDQKDIISDKYTAIVKLLATISFPLGVCLYFTGGELIRLFYGSNWDTAVPAFRILSLSLPFQIILSTIGGIYQAANNTKYLFINGAFNTCVTVSGFIISANYWRSIEAISWSWDITLTINVITSYYILYRIVLRSSVLSLLKILKYPVLNAIVLALFLYVEDSLWGHYNFLLLLVIKGVTSLVLSCALIQSCKVYDLHAMIIKVKHKIYHK